MDIVKQIMVESGEINPENDNDQTPSQLATWNHHLTLSELFEHMNNMMEEGELVKNNNVKRQQEYKK